MISALLYALSALLIYYVLRPFIARLTALETIILVASAATMAPSITMMVGQSHPIPILMGEIALMIAALTWFGLRPGPDPASGLLAFQALGLVLLIPYLLFDPLEALAAGLVRLIIVLTLVRYIRHGVRVRTATIDPRR